MELGSPFVMWRVGGVELIEVPKAGYIHIDCGDVRNTLGDSRLINKVHRLIDYNTRSAN